MLVLKFGGSSLGSPEALERVIQIIKRCRDKKKLIVVSAIGDTTDMLELIAFQARQEKREQALEILQRIWMRHCQIIDHFFSGNMRKNVRQKIGRYFENLERIIDGIAILKDVSPPVKDYLLSHGELLSAVLMSIILNLQDLRAIFIDSREVVITDLQFTRANPDLQRTKEKVSRKILPLLEGGYTVVMPGFIGSTIEGRTTTLGRGGSDYSASLLGSVLEVDEVQLWTDVDGILTADPTLVKEARPVEELSFQEAAELAYFGARVLHPATILPAIQKDIPVRVLNTFAPESGGTLITAKAGKNGNLVKSIAYKENTTVINIVSSRMFKAHSFLKKVFDILNKHHLAADLVSTSEVSVALAINPLEENEALLKELSSLGEVSLFQNRAIVCVVGEKIRNYPGIAGMIFSAIPEVPISMISQGGSEINISFVCQEKDLEYVINQLHKTFFKHCYRTEDAIPEKVESIHG